jgi:hypothetical protein
MNAEGGPLGWVNTLIAEGERESRRKRLGLLFSFWWHIWKERNRRIFKGCDQSTLQVSLLLQDQLHAFRKASGFPTWPSFVSFSQVQWLKLLSDEIQFFFCSQRQNSWKRDDIINILVSWAVCSFWVRGSFTWWLQVYMLLWHLLLSLAWYWFKVWFVSVFCFWVQSGVAVFKVFLFLLGSALLCLVCVVYSSALVCLLLVRVSSPLSCLCCFFFSFALSPGLAFFCLCVPDFLDDGGWSCGFWWETFPAGLADVLWELVEPVWV